MWAPIIIGSYAAFVLGCGSLCAYLARTKTDNPRAAGAAGFLLSLAPPVGLIYLAVLALKEEVGTV